MLRNPGAIWGNACVITVNGKGLDFLAQNRGEFVADLQFVYQLHGGLVRPIHAHAEGSRSTLKKLFKGERGLPFTPTEKL